MTLRPHPTPIMSEREEAMLDLTIAMECLATALRALANGNPLNCKETQDPIHWAKSRTEPLLRDYRTAA